MFSQIGQYWLIWGGFGGMGAFWIFPFVCVIYHFFYDFLPLRIAAKRAQKLEMPIIWDDLGRYINFI